MPLVNTKEMFEKADREGYAIGHLNTLTMDMLRGAVDAAEESNTPIILAYAEVFESLISVEDFAAIAKHMAQRSSVPIAVHLDHGSNFDVVVRAIRAGYSSVMIDASNKPLEENIAITKRVTEMCKPIGVSVEAELGHVGGLEGVYEDGGDYDEVQYTRVDEAERFVRETGIDSLAVAIGTVHGVYKSEPKLNFERLGELKAALKMPLVMHGGSGISDADLKRCVADGITKVNIFTEVTLDVMDQFMSDKDKSLLERCGDMAIRAKQSYIKKLDVLGSLGKA